MKAILYQGDNLAAADTYNQHILESATIGRPEPIQLFMWSTPYPGLRGFKVTADEYMEEWLPERVARWSGFMNPVTGVYAQVVKFGRSKGWYDRRQLKIADLICEHGGMEMIDVIPWDKLNPPPLGNPERYDHDAYEFIFLAAKSPEYTYHKYREPYKKSTKQRVKRFKIPEFQMTIWGESVPMAAPPRGKGVTGGYGGDGSDLHKDGAIQNNVFRMSSSGDEKRPRVKGGSYPMKLARRLILQYSDPGDWIADPCAGAGTSIVEAIRNGRNAIGVELAADRFDLMAEWAEKEAAKAGGYEVEKVTL